MFSFSAQKSKRKEENEQAADQDEMETMEHVRIAQQQDDSPSKIMRSLRSTFFKALNLSASKRQEISPHKL